MSAISEFADEILCNMENGKLCGAVFLDLSKAFDTVNHATLLKKLTAIGVHKEDQDCLVQVIPIVPPSTHILLT